MPHPATTIANADQEAKLYLAFAALYKRMMAVKQMDHPQLTAMTTGVGRRNSDAINAQPCAVTKKPRLAPVLTDPLSDRELEVLRCIIQGMKNLEIADALFISAETVKSHVSTAIQKLGVRDRTQAAVFALTYGLVEPDI